MKKSINELVADCYGMAQEKGWWDDGDRNIGELMMLFTCEVAEAYEEYRNGHDVTEVYYNDSKPDKPEGIPIELADVLIRIFDFCGRYGIDLESAIETKIEYNATRPYRHGNKKA